MGKDQRLETNIYHLWHPRNHAVTAKHIMQTWRTTWKNPEKVTQRLKEKKLGNYDGPTLINIADILVKC